MKKLVFGFLIVAATVQAMYFSNSASAGECWEESSYNPYKMGCEVIGKTNTGKYILRCCN
jgi:hypothetical protein